MTHDRGAEQQAVQAAAFDWLMSQRDPGFEDWEVFAGWLAADPTHQQAYHELAALDADLGDLAVPSAGAPAVEPVPEVAVSHAGSDTSNVVRLGSRAGNAAGNHPNDRAASLPARQHVSRRVWLSGALAASLVAIVGIGMFKQPSDSYRVETAMGEMQVVALADGSEISVNGNSSVLLSHSDPRRITLERGQLLIEAVHSDTAPFRVSAGTAELVDIGTIFDVTREGEDVTVAVSEGAVVYNPAAQNVRIDAGRRFTARDNGRTIKLAQIDPQAVGGWRGGQLVYDGIPLAEVAAEVSRTTGVHLRTTAATGVITFRGALRTDLEEVRLVNDLAALSGTSATKDSGGWTLSR